MIPVVILCGGLGTRLRSVVQEVPKVLAPVAGFPFLYYLIELLRRQGLGEYIILSSGYLGSQIEEFAAGITDPTHKVDCVTEPHPLGTGGAVAYAVQKCGIEGPFLIMNGDTWIDAPLRTLAADCLIRKPGEWVVGLTRMSHADRYGSVDFDPSTRQILNFREKHPIEATPEWINAGVYLAWSQTMPMFPEQAFSLETDGFPLLMHRNTLFARPFPEAVFLDIGIPEDYAKADILLDPQNQ